MFVLIVLIKGSHQDLPTLEKCIKAFPHNNLFERIGCQHPIGHQSCTILPYTLLEVKQDSKLGELISIIF